MGTISNYDFSTLSSFDFEVLVRDLMQYELNSITLESFTSGRDGGIDLRYSRDLSNALIIQCKHYSGSTLSNLKTELGKELLKVRKLKPIRYILVTSLALTPGNKSEITKLMSPYILSNGDILGKSDLNNLLVKFPEVEKNNFKLWLTSKAVMDRIMHSDVYARSQIALEEIQNKLRHYVQSKSYYEAKEILSETNYCIIAGVPGIGKSTLAEILLVDYLATDFEIYKVTSMNEVLRIYLSGKKQVFYYDDFLGQTSFEHKLNNNEDVDIVSFIKNIQKSKNTKFILTTREYILNQAKMNYERLSISNFDNKKCIINLSDYTLFNKAEILYNHLYFSNIHRSNIEQILKDKNYLKIVNHPNYSPRIIEWMTLISNKDNDEDYFNKFTRNLDNPHRLWLHAFEYQISDVAQRILMVMSTLTNVVLLEDLSLALASLDKIKFTNTSSNDFKKALKQLEGNFIKLDKIKEYTLIEFSNPSIRDFIDNYLYENQNDLQDLCRSAQFFDQCVTLWNNKVCRSLWNTKFSFDFSGILMELFDSDSYSLENYKESHRTPIKKRVCLAERFMFIMEVQESIEKSSLELEVIEGILYTNIESHSRVLRSNYTTLISKLNDVNFGIGISKADWISNVKSSLFEYLDDFDTYDVLSTLEGVLPEFFSETDKEYIRMRFEEIVESEQEYYLKDETDKENISGYYSCLEDVSSFLGVNLDYEFNALEERIKHLEENEEERDYDDDGWREHRGQRSNDNPSIDSLFDSLK